jgi:Protein of unknown function (DUF3306)
MSDDNFLSRWSRRKAAAKAEPVPEPAPVEQEATAAAQPDPAAAPPAEEVDLSALPPLDSITSATDVTAFLRKGVPEALRTAALRKVWTSDPAIRDFIGLSENSWDFNDPASIPGFGPLEMSSDQVRQMAAQLVGDVREAAEKVDGVLEQAAPQHDQPENLKTAPVESPNPIPDGAAPQQIASAAPQQSEPEVAEAPPRPRSHGSALPR